MNETGDRGVRSPLEPGTIIAGKYRIDRHLAEGGMGLVVAGTHLHLDQPVALKFLRDSSSLPPDALARFTREAKAAAQLKSEYVARVLDAGVTADGTPYMAMEYLEGESLAHALQQCGRLDIESAAEYVIQACEGLAEAHARGIVHRDIKPYNLFLVKRAPGWAAIKILDFGISKISLAGMANSSTGAIVGSPCYMSPEQLRSAASVDHRTDIWSLGATLYELLAGRSAFDANLTLPEIVAAILANPAPDLRVDRPDVPPALAAIVVRCLAKNRRARFESAGDLAMALLPFAVSRARVPAERAVSMSPAPMSGRESTGSEASELGLGTLEWPEGEPASGGSSGAALAVRTAAQRPDGQRSTAPIALNIVSPFSPPGPPTPASAFPRWGVPIAAATAIVVALIVASGGRVDTPKSNSAMPPAIAGTAPPTQDVTVLAPKHAEPERVELLVRVTPAYAHLSVDGQPVGNPFRASYPKDSPVHHVTARAWGYEAKTEDLPVSADTVVELALERHVEIAHVPTPASSSPPREHRPPSETLVGAASSAAALAGGAPPSVLPGPEISLAGGRAPLRPIEANDPYRSK